MVPNELEVDAVGLWQIVPCFKRDFGLQGAELERYVRQCISLLLERGAVPVWGNDNKDGWQIWTGLSSHPGPTLEKVIEYWHALGRDPDLGDIWFALPEFVK